MHNALFEALTKYKKKKKIICVDKTFCAVQYTLSRSKLFKRGLVDADLVSNPKVAQVHGTENRMGHWVAMFSGKLPTNLSDYPIFEQIKEIVLIGETLYFWCC